MLRLGNWKRGCGINAHLPPRLQGQQIFSSSAKYIVHINNSIYFGGVKNVLKFNSSASPRSHTTFIIKYFLILLCSNELLLHLCSIIFATISSD